MRDFPVQLPEGVDFLLVEEAVEACCQEMELIRAMKDTLAKYPGCVHWHFKKRRTSGTLEITLWPATNRLWVTIQEGRRAEWIEDACPVLIQRLEKAVRNARVEHS